MTLSTLLGLKAYDISQAWRTHSRAICIVLSLLLVLVSTLHTVWEAVNPSIDGEGYAIRGFTLYGYLHTGQWQSFWQLLQRPNQSICPVHYLPFFILPQSFAGLASYAAIQTLTTYAILAYAVFKLCQILRRPEWAPAVFLLSSLNNVALSDFYAFYLDMEFFAVGLAVIAWQIGIWDAQRIRSSILSGFGLGALFWVKPANALVFMLTFFLAELIRGISVLLDNEVNISRRQRLLNLLRHWGGQAVGFLPMVSLALFCGGAQTILQLINNNGVNSNATPLECHGLLRLFYFPLFLSFYYHVLLLGGILLATSLICRWCRSVKNTNLTTGFAGSLFIPVALSYLIFGELFSFGMLPMPMRSLLLILPLVWIAFSWFWEKQRLGAEGIFLMALIYASLVFSQKAFNLLRTEGLLTDDTYQLSASSWTQMTEPWHGKLSANRAICDSIAGNPPPAGIICVNSLGLQKDLAWRLSAASALRGEPLPYEVRNIFNFKGQYYMRALVGARLIILKTSPGPAAKESKEMLEYCGQQWGADQGLVQIGAMRPVGGPPVAYELLFQPPLTDALVQAANRSMPFSEIPKDDGDGAMPVAGGHYSRADAWRLLQAWYEKRLR